MSKKNIKRKSTERAVKRHYGGGLWKNDKLDGKSPAGGDFTDSDDYEANNKKKSKLNSPISLDDAIKVSDEEDKSGDLGD